MFLCDFSKAFDRVWHRGLLLKIKSYGIAGKLYLWLSDYLKNRTQCVKIANHISSKKRINAGVPQGSVLGPLLFLVYINDISDSLSSVCNLFADDTSLIFSSPNIHYLETVTNHDLEKLSQWSKKWLMSFNPQKTEIMLINNNTLYVPSFTFDNTIIPIVEYHKHSGIFLKF